MHCNLFSKFRISFEKNKRGNHLPVDIISDAIALKLFQVQTSGTFHEAIGTILAVVQFSGIMPVIGVTDKSVSKLHFKWFTLRAIFFVVSAILVSAWALLCIAVLFVTKFNFLQLSMSAPKNARLGISLRICLQYRSCFLDLLR